MCVSIKARQTLEEAGRLIETPLQAVEEVNIEFLVLVNVLADTLQDDHLHETLNDVRLGCHKNSCRSIACIWGPMKPLLASPLTGFPKFCLCVP